MTVRHNFSVHVSPGSAETLVRRGDIANYYSIAYFLSNTSAKNDQNRLMCVEVMVCYISVLYRNYCILLHCISSRYHFVLK